MKKIIAVIAIVFAFTLGTVFSADIATAVKPATEVFVTNTEPIEVTGSITSDPVCPAENIQHWMNFKVIINNELIHPSEPNIPPTIIFLPLSFSGAEVFLNDFKREMVTIRLNELGYTQADGNPVDRVDIGTVDINPDSVGYSTICAEN
jgi:hypothetical protein